MKRLAIINYETPVDIQESLIKIDIEPIPLPLSKNVEKPIAGHPDLQLFIYHDTVYCNPDIDLDFIKKIENRINVIFCQTVLKKEYPEDVPYNIALVGQFAIHKIDYMEKKIKLDMINNEVKLINTNQGYSKCSTFIVNEKSIITSDKSIFDVATKNDIDSLLISPGNIELPGYKYGFIGGASGKIDDTVLLTGSIEHHPDYHMIMAFIEKQNVKTKFLSNNKIIDLGSIFII